MHLLPLFLVARLALATEPPPAASPAPATAAPDAPAASPEPAASPAAAASPEPSPSPEPLALPVAEPAAAPVDARARYLEALTAWQRRNFAQALILSTDAVNADPLLGEAWLLRSYAHLRAGERAPALAAARLARASPRSDVRAAARALESRLTAPTTRDDAALWFGLGPQIELRYGQVVPHAGVDLGVAVPVHPRWAARAEVRWTAMDAGTLGVAGARVSAMAARALPLGGGQWTFTPSLGPALWIATGQYWASGAKAYPGARLALDLDARLSPAFGVYVAAGTEVYPSQMAELGWLAEPFEATTGLRFWFAGVPDVQR